MITHVRAVTVPVRNQDAAVEFYTRMLDFIVRIDQPMGGGGRWIELVCPRSQTAIVPFTPPSMESRIGTFTGIVLGCDDAEQTYRELSSRGVEFTEKPAHQPWGGITAQFKDQDGNTFVLVQDRQ